MSKRSPYESSDELLPFVGRGLVYDHEPEIDEIEHDDIRRYSPDPDNADYIAELVLRTDSSGEIYASLILDGSAWPDFTKADLLKSRFCHDAADGTLKLENPLELSNSAWRIVNITVTHTDTAGQREWVDIIDWSNPVTGEAYMTRYTWR